MNDTATATAPVEDPAAAAAMEPAPAVDPTPIENDADIANLRIGRLEDELRAHKTFRERCDAINRRITLAGQHLALCAKEHKAAKEDHEAALEELRSFTSGDVQTTIDVTDPKAAAADDRPNQDSVPLAEQPDLGAVVGTYGAWQYGLTAKQIEAATALAFACHEPEVSKRKVKALALMGGRPHAVVVLHHYADASGFVDLLPLVDKSEWDAAHAETYGSPVYDLGEESPDLTTKRKRGGEFCGWAVKVGRQKLIVAPESFRIRAVFTQIQGSPGPAEYRAKALLPYGFRDGVLETPADQLADRMAELLVHSYPKTSAGFHEGLLRAIADNLKVTPEEVRAAAEADPDRFAVELTAVFGNSDEAVRLLAAAPVKRADFDDDAIDTDTSDAALA